ncbi:MAG: UDP-N-acetylmuramoyl-tripeptide--D-alanyl-D-alanine ligase [Lachnospiraceae bacterium]|jgi:UDP-N-acetylmuramoyl-tripeptide--D-alanyl-D-alanine ligase
MKNMTIDNILMAVDGTIAAGGAQIPQGEAADVVIDSRKVGPGSIFIALKGEKTDGHLYIGSAFEKGAMAVICEEVPENAGGLCIQVKDSLEALRKLASFYRQQLPVKTIGVTGSVGKTSTKEMIASVLSQHYRVHKTEGNFNNVIGLPLTVFGIRETDEIAVLEMGIEDFGEMHRLSEIARPDIVVMTVIGRSHLEHLGDLDGVLRAKSEIFDFMNPKGTVFVNGDDPKLATIVDVHGTAPVHFGLSPCDDVWADHIEIGEEGSTAVIHPDRNTSFKVEIHIPGEHSVRNAAAAAAVGVFLGLSTEEIQAGIAQARTIAGRNNVIRTDSLTIIDDCYNANPNSMEASIGVLRNRKSRRVAVLGDMLELGPDEKQLHYDTGVYAGKAGIDRIICVGPLARSLYEGAVSTGAKADYFADKEALKDGLGRILQKGDTVLVKASHGMGLAEIVAMLQEMKL